jgi:hypothetical protein
MILALRTVTTTQDVSVCTYCVDNTDAVKYEFNTTSGVCKSGQTKTEISAGVGGSCPTGGLGCL